MTTLIDRARGTILCSAAGDALGAPYEFNPPVPDSEALVLHATMAWEAGEWTDDTSMAIPIRHEVAAGADLLDGATQGHIVRKWVDWALYAPDVGHRTELILSLVRNALDPADSEDAGGALDAAGAAGVTPAGARTGVEGTTRPEPADTADAAAADVCRRASAAVPSQGKPCSNGSLMRTAPVALAYLGGGEGEEGRLAEAARTISDLTHFDGMGGDACVIWCLAIRHAVLTGELDVRRALRGPTDASGIPSERVARWCELLDEAEGVAHPREIRNNGSAVAALQAAWASIALTRGRGPGDAIHLAVRSGYDTDTVACITGALAGAYYGAARVPADIVKALHGWPGRGWDAKALTALVDAAVPRQSPARPCLPSPVPESPQL